MINENRICESCVYYPPSVFGEKPCSTCNPDDPLMSCYTAKAAEILNTTPNEKRKPHYTGRCFIGPKGKI